MLTTFETSPKGMDTFIALWRCLGERAVIGFQNLAFLISYDVRPRHFFFFYAV